LVKKPNVIQLGEYLGSPFEMFYQTFGIDRG